MANESVGKVSDIVGIKLVVINDYDGYFRQLVQQWIDRKAIKIGVDDSNGFKHQVIEITAGPYRPYVVAYESTKRDDIKILKLDFYSAFRVGFGSLSDNEIEQLINLF